MNISPESDEILLDAMARAADKKVLFLVDSTADIDVLIRRTTRLTAERLAAKLGSESARKFFKGPGIGWAIDTSLGGRLSFYPAELTTGEEESAFEFVFWPDHKGRYEVIPFNEWVRLRKTGNIWRPLGKTSGVSRNGPKTIWDRIAEDDDPEG